jgi:hypothetical protein
MNNVMTQKSQLAKLMASENLTVQHNNVQTASFDVVGRVLTLPIFDEMSSELYDLMVSHEVGHAIWTPKEGWHETASELGPIWKGILNVVEDARIEKKIKNKFPGVVTAYRKGYADLLQRDFFGIAGKDIAELSFIDRINLHFKLGTLVNLNFEGDEAEWIEKIANADTFEEVLEITNALFEEFKQQAEEKAQEEANQAEENQDDVSEETEETESNDTDGDDDAGEDETGNDIDDGFSTGNSTGPDLDDDGMDEFEEAPEQVAPRTAEEIMEEEMSAETEETLHGNMGQLIKNDDRDWTYYSVNEYKNFKDYIVPVERVIADFEKHNSQNHSPIPMKEIQEKLKIWRDANKNAINYMVKEFEMKKKADELKRASVSKSGEIDMKKVFGYKYNEDLFKKVTTVPGGKNHGFVMLLDWSGSMAPNMSSTIDQLLNLVMFCRKVKIPFEVYAFTSDWVCNSEDFVCPEKMVANGLFPNKEVKLVQWFASKMTISQFNSQIENLFSVRECLSNGRYYRFVLPDAYGLSSTPLDDSLLLMSDIVNEFRKNTKVQISNLIVLTDGESHECAVAKTDDYAPDSLYVSRAYTNNYRTTTVVLDSITKKSYKVRGRSLTDSLLEIVKDRTGANTIGFFVMDDKPREIRTQASRFGIYDVDIVKQIRTNRFIEVKNSGFDSYFLIPGGKELQTGSTSIDVDRDASKSKLTTAFKKAAKKKTADRVLVSRFMDIAA